MRVTHTCKSLQFFFQKICTFVMKYDIINIGEIYIMNQIRRAVVSKECPYFATEKKDSITGECGKIKFYDKQHKRDFVYVYCAHPTGYNKCTMKCLLDKYYERKFKREDEYSTRDAKNDE